MPEQRPLQFDVSALISDLGGHAKAARITGKARTTPYKWVEQGFVNTKILEKIKTTNPELDMNSYFK